jgi:PTH2 family peptidyl-tRNA hydrolase
MKQVIVIRKDLKMRRGKEIAQGGHAVMHSVLRNMDHPDVKAWLGLDPERDYTISEFVATLGSEDSFLGKKITVRVNSEEELLGVYEQAKSAGLICSLIQDKGFTEFNGVMTYTTVAIGPGDADTIDKITGDLVLY